MGPKISEAKTPPLRKLASLTSLPSSTLNPPPHTHTHFHLNTSFSFTTTKITALPTSACFEKYAFLRCPLLSACSNFKHAYGGRMCLWPPSASLRRVLLCLSLSPQQLLYLSHSSLYPTLLLSISLFLSHSVSHSHLICQHTPHIIVTHAHVCTPDKQARMSTHSHKYECRHTNMNMHTWMYKLRQADSLRTQPHSRALTQQWQTGALLHSNTLRICRATLLISGTLLRAVDFWRGKHTVVSTGYQLMPQLPHPSTCHPVLHKVYITRRWPQSVQYIKLEWHPRNECNWKIRSLPIGGGRSKMEN